MKLTIINTSVVVTAQNHNPTVLHPSFLEKQGIVSGVDLSEPPICTPAFAVVKYANGLTFTTELNKFQVVDNQRHEDFSASQIPDLTITYIKSLPHVSYTGVGINLVGLIECENPDTVIIDRFLKQGDWNDESLKVKDLRLRFTYDVSDAVLNVSCTAATVQSEALGKRTGIALDVNYHTEVSSLEHAENAINHYDERWNDFPQKARCIFGLEG